MNIWIRLVAASAALAVLSCGSGGVAGAPEDQGFGSPPSEPAPTGSKWEGIEVEGACGRVGLAWVLVDEVCAGTDDPGYLDAFHTPMFRDGAILNGLLYAVDATHLWVLDVSDPAAPVRKAMLAGFGQPLALATYGSKLLIAAGGEGLLVVDTADPLAPTLASAIELPGPALDVTLDGDRAVLATGAGGLSVVDLAVEPPALVSSLPTPGFAAGVEARDGRAYVAACDTFAVVDLGSGALLSSTWLPASTQQGVLVAPAKDVELVGDVAFVAAGRYGAVAIDVSTVPESASVLGNCTVPGDLAFYASGVRASADGLFVAGGEWGVAVEELAIDPKLVCAGMIAPTLMPLPTSPGECSTDAPWQVVPWQDLWAPPPPARDPIQVLPAEDRLYAFGDARRIGLRAVDMRAPNVGLATLGRYDEPRLVNGIWAQGDRVLVTGPAGGLFWRDEAALLTATPELASLASEAIAGTFLGDGRWAVATAEGRIDVEGVPDPLLVSTPVWSSGLGSRGTELVVPVASGALLIDPDSSSTALVQSGQVAELPEAIAVDDGEVVVAAPEWVQAVRLTDNGPSPLPPHEIFGLDEVWNASLWRVGLPRRLLVSTSAGLVEIASLADKAGLALHGASTASMALPGGTYVGAAAEGDRLYLVSSDRGRYRSELRTIHLGGASPTLVEVTAFTGVAGGVAVDGDRLYLADADRGIRVYGIAGAVPELLGVVELEVTP